MRIKTGVDLRGLSPIWGVAFPLIQQIFASFHYDCIVTSANDGMHGPHSLHYKGKALDLRTKHLQMMDKATIIDTIRESLGAQFDVVFEDAGLANEHLHCEFDPKETGASEV